jgi:hypothetical protein
VVGLNIPIPENKIEEFISLSDEEIRKKLVTHVEQFYFVSSCGSFVFPLGFFGTIPKANDPNWLFNIYDNYIQLFERNGIRIHWGSTDGGIPFSFIEKMKDKYPDYRHFFDYVHILKLLRNEMNKPPILQCNGTPFYMHDIWKILDENPKPFEGKLSNKDLFPTDDMKMKFVENLLKSTPFLTDLAKSDAQKQAVVYCEKMVEFVSLFESVLSFDQLMVKIEHSEDYFKSIVGITDDLRLMIKTTLSSFKDFLRDQLVKYPHNRNYAYLGTNICELGFSMVRHKIKKPGFKDYADYFCSSHVEMMKENSSNNIFPYRKKNQSDCYNNTFGADFLIEEVNFSFLSEDECSTISETNEGTPFQKSLVTQFCKKWSVSNLPTIREATTKSRPDLEIDPRNLLEPFGGVIFCAVKWCKHLRPFKTIGTLENHYSSIHDIRKDSIKEVLLLNCQSMKEKKVNCIDIKDFSRTQIFHRVHLPALPVHQNKTVVCKKKNYTPLFCDLETTGIYHQSNFIHC